MYEELRAKIEKSAERYADLLNRRIEEAEKLSGTELGKACENIDAAVRSFGFMTAVLEKIDRLSRTKDGQGD